MKLQLHEILAAAGFLMFLLGSASADSEMFFTPAVLFIVGLGLMIWSAYEDGTLRGGKKK